MNIMSRIVSFLHENDGQILSLQYAYGIPPSPIMSGMPPPGMMYVSPEQQQHQHFQAQQAYPLRRAGSMNAKIMSQVSNIKTLVVQDVRFCK